MPGFITYSNFMDEYLVNFVARNFYWFNSYSGGPPILYYKRNSPWQLIKIDNQFGEARSIFTFQNINNGKTVYRAVLHPDIINCKKLFPRNVLILKLP